MRNLCVVKIGCLLTLSLFWGSIVSLGQSDYIPLGSRQYDVLDRFEVLLKQDSTLNYSAFRPYSRKTVAEAIARIRTAYEKGEISLSKTDLYNLRALEKDNFDWNPLRPDGDTTMKLRDVFSRKVTQNPIYFGVKKGDFSIYAEPVFNFSLGKDNQTKERLFTNFRGFYVRGTLTKNLGFYTYATEDQERDPLYVRKYVNTYDAVPGEGFYKIYNGNGYDYFDARGGIMYHAGQGIDMQFAYDKIFIGDGIRSLILSDFSNSYLFLKIDTHFWRFHYYNLFTQLTGTHTGGNTLYPQKFMTLHYLDMQVNRWLNIGVFEDIMFHRSNGYEMTYLNPVIFYRSAEQQMGSPDKVTLGATFKANAFKKTQFYGQLIINEWYIKEIIHYSRGYYANKQALQLGMKRIDLFGVKSLDLQLEANWIRPFVYSHYDTVGSWTNYNQPLAHPMGANLREFIGVLHYQPMGKLNLKASILYNTQGLDSAGKNFGSNPFRLYTDREGDYGYFIGSGIPAHLTRITLAASYEILPNMFFDASFLYRFYRVQGASNFDSRIFNVGIRLNMQKREFEF